VKKTLLLLSIAVLSLASFASADTFALLGSRAAQAPTDVFDWGQLGPEFTFNNSPSIVFSAAGTNVALVGNNDGSQFISVTSGSGWNGNFDYGENLIWTGNSNFGFGGLGPFAMIFASPVASIGFGIQSDFYGQFTAAVDVYDSNLNYMGTGFWNGNSFFSLAGDNLFVGFVDKTAPNIGAIVISTYAGGSPADNDFAIDAVSIGYTTPEPSSFILLGSGLLGMAGVVRRKLNR